MTALFLLPFPRTSPSLREEQPSTTIPPEARRRHQVSPSGKGASGMSAPAVSVTCKAGYKVASGDGGLGGGRDEEVETKSRATSSGVSSTKCKRFMACPPPVALPSRSATPSASASAWGGKGRSTTSSASLVSRAPRPRLVKGASRSPDAEAGASKTSPAQPGSGADGGCVEGEGGKGREAESFFNKQPVLTLGTAGIQNGSSICFFRRAFGGTGKGAVGQVYEALTAGLVEDMGRLLRGEGPLGRVHLIKVRKPIRGWVGICPSFRMGCGCSPTVGWITPPGRVGGASMQQERHWEMLEVAQLRACSPRVLNSLEIWESLRKFAKK